MASILHLVQDAFAISCFLTLSLLMIKYTLVAIIFLILFSDKLFAQQQLLIEQLQKSQTDTTRLRLLKELGELYQKRRHRKSPKDLDSAKICFLKALALSKYGQDSSQYGRGWLLNKLGEVATDQSKIAEGKAYFKQSIDFFHNNHDVENEAKALENTGIYLCRPQNNDPQVAAYLSRAIKLYTRLNNTDRVIYDSYYTAHDRYYVQEFDSAQTICIKLIEKYKNTRFHNLELVYYLMSCINRYEGNYNKALYYALNGVRRMSLVNDTSQASKLYGELAEVYQASGNIDHSIYYYKKCIAVREKLHVVQQYIFRTAGFIIQMMITQNRAAEGLKYITDMARRHPPDSEYEAGIIAQIKGWCYEALGAPQLAEKNYRTMIRDLGRDSTGIGVEARFDLASFYVKQKRFDEAVIYLHNLSSESAVMASKVELLNFKVDSAKKKFKSAIDHYQQYKVINDSIFSSSKTAQIQQLQVEYETEKKDKDIRLLKSQSLAQKSNVQQANYMRNITLGGIVVLLLFLALLYNSYRFKQQKNETLNQLVIEKDVLLGEKESLLLEKQWLLKEIHHRVKNNLAIVMGLLNRQSAYIDNEVALAAIKNSQNRMRSIALIHQKLYQSENLDLISMPEYIDELITHLKDSFDLGTRIIFEKEVGELNLDVSQAVPLGLIINEAITNSIKYAYPDETPGNIQISLIKDREGQNILQIKDYGPGLKNDFDPDKINSMGMNLIRGLTRQLGGRFEMDYDNGVLIRIEFKTEMFIAPSTTV